MEGPQNKDINGIKSRIDAINESLLALERQEQSAPELAKNIEAQRRLLQDELSKLEDELT